MSNKNFGNQNLPRYEPVYPEKYLGDHTNIIYRSSWELDAFKFCDMNKYVIAWASEEIQIPYLLPTRNGKSRKANYYPDLYIEYYDREGNYLKELIEIKPKKQTRASKARNPKTKLMENEAYLKNRLKWDAATKFCKKHGIEFKILHEGSMFK